MFKRDLGAQVGFKYTKLTQTVIGCIEKNLFYNILVYILFCLFKPN
jgi:hypothetical protein